MQSKTAVQVSLRKLRLPLCRNRRMFSDCCRKKGEAVQLKAENKWSYTWKDLPQKENGKDIKYTVKKVGKLKGYTVKVDDKNHGNIIITNTHIEDRKSVV